MIQCWVDLWQPVVYSTSYIWLMLSQFRTSVSLLTLDFSLWSDPTLWLLNHLQTCTGNYSKLSQNICPMIGCIKISRTMERRSYRRWKLSSKWQLRTMMSSDRLSLNFNVYNDITSSTFIQVRANSTFSYRLNFQRNRRGPPPGPWERKFAVLAPRFLKIRYFICPCPDRNWPIRRPDPLSG